MTTECIEAPNPRGWGFWIWGVEVWGEGPLKSGFKILELGALGSCTARAVKEAHAQITDAGRVGTRTRTRPGTLSTERGCDQSTALGTLSTKRSCG